MCIFLVTCQSLESGGPSLPRCGASVSSPSGAARQDLLCDWARAKSQQGGVKPAGMFHIHNRHEYIISPSGYRGLSGWKQETLLDNIGETSVFFFCFFLFLVFFTAAGRKTLSARLPPAALIPRTDAAVGRIRRLGPACLQERR